MSEAQHNRGLGMDVQEIRERVAILEQVIDDKLRAFTEKTGITVDGIYINPVEIERHGEPTLVASYEVTIEVKL